MPQINVRVSAETKKEAEKACKEMGLTLSSAINMFLVKVGREKRIPFTIEADPFYNPANMKRINDSIAEFKAGKGKEHELIDE